MQQGFLEGKLKSNEENILTGLAAEYLIRELQMMAPVIKSFISIKESLEETGMFQVELGTRAIGIRSIDEHRWENGGWFILRITCCQQYYSVWIWDSLYKPHNGPGNSCAESENWKYFSEVEELLRFITGYCAEFRKTYSASFIRAL